MCFSSMLIHCHYLFICLFMNAPTEIKRIQKYAGESCVLLLIKTWMPFFSWISGTNKCELQLFLCFLSVDVVLDSNTANSVLIVSSDRKQVRHGGTRQELPDNPERFDTLLGVLGKEGYSSGAFYFEVSDFMDSWIANDKAKYQC